MSVKGESRLGEMLAKTERAKGGNGSNESFNANTRFYRRELPIPRTVLRLIRNRLPRPKKTIVAGSGMV